MFQIALRCRWFANFSNCPIPNFLTTPAFYRILSSFCQCVSSRYSSTFTKFFATDIHRFSRFKRRIVPFIFALAASTYSVNALVEVTAVAIQSAIAFLPKWKLPAQPTIARDKAETLKVVTPGVYRYGTIPGLWEIYLAEELSRIRQYG